MKIFVSYTVRDNELSRAVLEQLSIRLKKFGTVYTDLIDNNSEHKQERVVSELDSSDIVLLIESSGTYSSPWVKFEIERAASKGIKVYPVPYQRVMNFLTFDSSLKDLISNSTF